MRRSLLPTRNPREGFGFDGIKMRGGNLMVATGAVAPYVETWQTFWNVFDWDGHIRPQIDDAGDLLGVNGIRTIGSLRDEVDSPATLATYLNRWDEVIDYCAEQGLFVYVCGGHAEQRDIPSTTIAEIADGVAALAAHVEDRWNVIGIDMLQEVNSWWMTGELRPEVDVLADLLTVATAVEAAAPTLPRTFSRSIFNAGTSGQGVNYPGLVATLGELLSFIDLHIYYTPGASDLDALYAVSDRPVIFGEFGIAASETTEDRVARFNAVDALAQDARCGGALVWSVWDLFGSTDPTTQYGLITDADGTRREDVAVVYEAFPTAQPPATVRANFRRWCGWQGT